MEKRRNLLDLENINVDSLTSKEVYNSLFSKLGINNYADLEKYIKDGVIKDEFLIEEVNLKKNGINIKLRDISTERLKVDEKTSFALEHYGIHNYQELGIYIGNNTLMIADNMFLLNAFKVTASLVLENNKKNIKNR